MGLGARSLYLVRVPPPLPRMLSPPAERGVNGGWDNLCLLERLLDLFWLEWPSETPPAIQRLLLLIVHPDRSQVRDQWRPADHRHGWQPLHHHQSVSRSAARRPGPGLAPPGMARPQGLLAACDGRGGQPTRRPCIRSVSALYAGQSEAVGICFSQWGRFAGKLGQQMCMCDPCARVIPKRGVLLDAYGFWLPEDTFKPGACRKQFMFIRTTT